MLQIWPIGVREISEPTYKQVTERNKTDRSEMR